MPNGQDEPRHLYRRHGMLAESMRHAEKVSPTSPSPTCRKAETVMANKGEEDSARVRLRKPSNKLYVILNSHFVGRLAVVSPT